MVYATLVKNGWECWLHQCGPLSLQWSRALTALAQPEPNTNTPLNLRDLRPLNKPVVQPQGLCCLLNKQDLPRGSPMNPGNHVLQRFSQTPETTKRLPCNSKHIIGVKAQTIFSRGLEEGFPKAKATATATKATTPQLYESTTQI